MCYKCSKELAEEIDGLWFVPWDVLKETTSLLIPKQYRLEKPFLTYTTLQVQLVLALRHFLYWSDEESRGVAEESRGVTALRHRLV